MYVLPFEIRVQHYTLSEHVRFWLHTGSDHTRSLDLALSLSIDLSLDLMSL